MKINPLSTLIDLYKDAMPYIKEHTTKSIYTILTNGFVALLALFLIYLLLLITPLHSKLLIYCISIGLFIMWAGISFSIITEDNGIKTNIKKLNNESKLLLRLIYLMQKSSEVFKGFNLGDENAGDRYWKNIIAVENMNKEGLIIIKGKVSSKIVADSELSLPERVFLILKRKEILLNIPS